MQLQDWLKLTTYYRQCAEREDIEGIERCVNILKRKLPIADRSDSEMVAMLAKLKSVHVAASQVIQNKMDSLESEMNGMHTNKARDMAYKKIQLSQSS
ncbi:hypothetical protein SAMN04488136_10917 [Vibrio xiamenensis]|uniref:Protein FliT n=1 Tax=Vibrio xiamenensis TaxID=861298 RepID=A0A1G7ZYS6_9VIBR|nr:hypothetical protein [Vibrio xiamenensis]SDH13360.1 hypothetical protein SAMN04488136_10917 [Vibrio xiamenensis]